MYIDPRDAMNSEVKLLIASLTADEYDNKGQLGNKRNELGLPMLEDFGRKINILHNELHSTVPVSRYDAATKTIVPVPVIAVPELTNTAEFIPENITPLSPSV